LLIVNLHLLKIYLAYLFNRYFLDISTLSSYTHFNNSFKTSLLITDKHNNIFENPTSYFYSKIKLIDNRILIVINTDLRFENPNLFYNTRRQVLNNKLIVYTLGTISKYNFYTKSLGNGLRQ